jgi:hypothetical protein
VTRIITLGVAVESKSSAVAELQKRLPSLILRVQPHFTEMPGTHLLPPNLLKLFAPRPPLPYARPVDKDIDRVTPKNVSSVAEVLSRLKEASTAVLINAGETDTGMEEGEEPIFTHAEEIKRQIRREERKKRRTEEFKIAKETCKQLPLPYMR